MASHDLYLRSDTDKGETSKDLRLRSDADKVISGDAFFVSLNDDIGVADSISIIGFFEKLLSNTVGITDSITKIGIFFKSLSSTIGLTDDISIIGTFKKLITDNVGLTDAIIASVKKLASISDLIGLTDIITKIGIFIKIITNNIGLTDIITKIGTYKRLLSDSEDVGDMLLASVSIVKSISDDIGLTDILIGIKGTGAKFVSIFDSVGVTDTISRIGTFIKFLSDNIGLTDNLTRIGTFIKTISDNIGLADILTAIKFGAIKFVNLADTIGITDANVNEVDDGLKLIDGEDAGSAPWEWDSIVENGSSIFELSSVNPNHGDNSYRIISDGSNITYGITSWVNDDKLEIWIRFYMYIDPDLILTGNKRTYVVALRDNGIELCYFGFRAYGTTPDAWYLYYGGGGVGSFTNFSTGEWHRIELLHIAGTPGVFRLHVDGDTAIGFGPADNSNDFIDSIKLGSLETKLSNTDYIDFDDIKVMETRPGAYSLLSTLSTILGVVRSIVDGINISDIITKIGTFKQIIIDNVNISDVITKIGIFKRTIIDDISVSDIITRIRIFIRSIVDTIGLIDILSRILISLSRILAPLCGTMDYVSLSGTIVSVKLNGTMTQMQLTGEMNGYK